MKKEGEQEDSHIYRDRKSLITPSLHLCLCAMFMMMFVGTENE